jgi:hypothetical protein
MRRTRDQDANPVSGLVTDGSRVQEDWPPQPTRSLAPLEPSAFRQSNTDVRALLRAAAQFVTDNPGPILTGHESAKPQNFLIYLGKTAQGYLAASSKSPTHGAFSLNATSGSQMMQRLHEFDQIRSAGKTFTPTHPARLPANSARAQ